MSQWIVSLGVLIFLALAMPALIRSTKNSASRRSRIGAGSAGLGDALSGFFNPSKRAATEQIELHREIGAADTDAADSAGNGGPLSR